jgi:hypothetical protein
LSATCLPFVCHLSANEAGAARHISPYFLEITAGYSEGNRRRRLSPHLLSSPYIGPYFREIKKGSPQHYF